MTEGRETERLASDAAGIARAADLLRGGGLVAFPTETVYGLGADATDDRAVARIFEAKGRPRFNPLIVHLPDTDAAAAVAEMGPQARALAAAFWPGPLTLVLPRRAGGLLSPLVSAGLDSVAVRVPGTALARAILARSGVPVAAPSANPSGRVSPTEAAHVLAGLDGRIDAVLDGGACAVGVESTILSLTGGPRLLRHGGVPAEALARVLGEMPAEGADDPAAPSAPGQMASHYAPRGQVRLNATDLRPGEVLLGFGSVEAELNLSRAGDLTEAAAMLFRHLQMLDRAGHAAIAVSPVPERGLGRAINDRLRRAAAPRE
ncbi:threonylcarbamoyl-AMP synthase [Palleronia sediminis]|uniref:Threonylcarbamoyl-AMP synthase n=1 Tax=Palleronia sediminis TaxID=2547833 RepID=A0A4R6AEN5_9RHOB|nr:L-threonylcarbamoyladenylate synthase [Palleronia sediminis]TDL81605.1 threonylcarbamoyl-AMP synthase [Palleronia sediminis]